MSKAISKRAKTKKTQPIISTATAANFSVSACFKATRDKSTLPIFIVSVDDYPTWVASAPSEIQNWLFANQFRAKAGACALLPQSDGCAGAVITVQVPHCPWEYAGLARILPAGSFEAEPEVEPDVAYALCLGWLLSSYQFNRYKSKGKAIERVLVWPEGTDQERVLAVGEGICLARDMINTPASDMGPDELASIAETMAKKHGASIRTIVGEALLHENYPMIHAVGRASVRQPRLIDIKWGKSSYPQLTLVGKGVCFDTGGLDLKPPQYMKLMKKDMGGAALVLGLAHAIMSSGLKVQLRVLVPAVENSVAGNAMRPLDVLSTRKGITVEVGDTDAEGRLILGDALFEAASGKPDLIVDAATLTGAARVALGPEVPAVFTNSDTTWAALLKASETTFDPLFRLPLYEGYRRKLESKIADLCNISPDPYAGAITAALFLREFAGGSCDWVHIDTMGYNTDSRPGRPAGGEALGLMATFSMLSERYDAEPAQREPKSKRSLTKAKGERKSPSSAVATGKKRATRKPASAAKKATLH